MGSLVSGGGGGGDMKRAVYDPNKDGVIAIAQLDVGIGDMKAVDYDPVMHGSRCKYVASDVILAADDTESTCPSVCTTWTKLKEIELMGTVAVSVFRVTFDLKDNSGSGNYARGQIRKDGAVHGTLQNGNNVYATKTEDLAFSGGDKVQVWVQDTGGTMTEYVRNFRIKGTLEALEVEE